MIWSVVLFLTTGQAWSQTVFDLATIEPDVKIVGTGWPSKIHNAVILDIDDSGSSDLFLFDQMHQVEYGGQCIFGFLEFFQTQTGPVVDLADGNYDIVIVEAYSNGSFGHALETGDWNNDGICDLAIGDPTADQTGCLMAVL